MTGDDLKQARKALALSRRHLAELCNLHPDTVRYWEKKPLVDFAGHAPSLMINKLGIPLPPAARTKRKQNQSAFGYLVTPKRARHGVLEKKDRKCGANTRKSTKCRAQALPGKARCKLHGGLSTGPKTAQGRKRIIEAQKKRRSKTCSKIPEDHLPKS